jgi:von Willebrand factor type A domain-containing protein
MTRAYVALVFALTVAACGPKEFDSLCREVPTPEGCGTPCKTASDCNTGYYCSADSKCDIQCTLGGTQCGDGYACTADGRCEDDHGMPMNGPDANCPAVNFTPMPKTPSIGLVLDQSQSMYDNNLGTVTRYKAMRDALVGTTGVVTQLEAKAYFGATLYTCGANQPALTRTPRALNNAAALRTSIDSKTSGANTPTPEAINDMVAQFAAAPPPADSPPVIVLATDGVPNTCPDPNVSTKAQSVQAVKNAYAAKIPVYVLAINLADQHFQDMANAGQGWQPGQPNYPYYLANDAAQLKAAFDTIIKGVISCDLSLTSSIDPGQAMSGTVTINGQTLTYGTDWILVNGNTIRILGNACTSLKTATNPMVGASFPCGSVIF